MESCREGKFRREFALCQLGLLRALRSAASLRRVSGSMKIDIRPDEEVGRAVRHQGAAKRSRSRDITSITRRSAPCTPNWQSFALSDVR